MRRRAHAAAVAARVEVADVLRHQIYRGAHYVACGSKWPPRIRIANTVWVVLATSF